MTFLQKPIIKFPHIKYFTLFVYLGCFKTKESEFWKNIILSIPGRWWCLFLFNKNIDYLIKI